MQETITRCPWVIKGDTLYESYHDLEWGVPIHDDRKHFELLILESAQAGLSWRTVLGRREGYRKAFADFNPAIVAQFGEEEVKTLMTYPDIIRHEKKIRSAISNAKRFCLLQKEYGSFDAYIWQFVNGKTLYNKWKNLKEIPSQTEESKALSLDLKKRGFSFVGPTTMYAYMQAAGLVFDHTTDCFCFHQSLPR